MIGLLQTIKEHLHPESWEEAEFRALTEELGATRLALHQAEGRFNTASDPLLVEASVFEIKALQARHAYLLRRIKGLMAAPQRAEKSAPAHSAEGE